jgi:hypothetical protein
MGLDITLAKIIDYEADEFSHLVVEESPELFTFFHQYIRKKHFAYPDEEYDSEVYFYSELAYQRKGVIPAFYHEFRNDVCLTMQHEVENMANFIDPKYKVDFNTCFVKQFVEKQTVIIISW